MSFRLRVALLFAGLVVLVVVAFGAALFLGQSRQTHALVKAGVGRTAQHLAERREPWRHGSAMPGPPIRPPSSHVQLRDVDGVVTERTQSLGESELPLSDEGREAVLQGQQWTEIVNVDDERLMVFSAPVWGKDGVDGIVQVAGSLTLADQYLGRLRTTLVLITLATIVVAFLGGWVVAGAVLEPVKRITQTAHEIGQQRDFGKRVAHTGPDDELGRLTHTFNDMLSALESAYVGLEDALRSQRRFVADASHELRTPLTTIRGNAELLLMDPPIGRLDRDAAVTDMIEESDRLIALTNELLALARADAGRQLDLEPVALVPLMAELERLSATIANGRSVGFGPTPDTSAVADRNALKQVMLNLIENALKYTPDDASIEVTIEAVADAVTISVADTGPGIDPDHLPRVFERFHRGDEIRTSSGTGLGLSIAKSLVESMGGTIGVESDPGVGATFRVRLRTAAQET